MHGQCHMAPFWTVPGHPPRDVPAHARLGATSVVLVLHMSLFIFPLGSLCEQPRSGRDHQCPLLSAEFPVKFSSYKTTVSLRWAFDWDPSRAPTIGRPCGGRWLRNGGGLSGPLQPPGVHVGAALSNALEGMGQVWASVWGRYERMDARASSGTHAVSMTSPNGGPVPEFS